MVGVALASAAQVRAQSFEVATVKRSPPATGDLININLGTVRNGKVTLGNATLSECVRFAYEVASEAQISGADWIKSRAERFDIVAQAPPETPREQLLDMLQALLADRLKLVLHHEQRELPFLALVVAKSGPKLHAVHDDPANAVGNTNGAGRILNKQISMQTLASLLSRFERQTVVDLTGLQGLFEVKLEWTPAGTEPIDNPSIFYRAPGTTRAQTGAAQGPAGYSRDRPC